MDMKISSAAADTSHGGVGRLALLAMATAGGIAVANIYYNQPMLGLIEAEFQHQTATGLIPTATQLGYALGLFLLLPLGDLVHRRPLIIGQFVLLAVTLLLAALAPTAWLLVAASFLVGTASTVAQQIVPFAASLAAPEKRGATIGTVMAGVLSGILFSRTLSGFVGQHAGWREMFWIGVPMALIAAAMMFLTLPHHRPASRMRYHTAMRSLVHLWKHQPSLRTATLVQAALFASFTAFWTILALYLQGPSFDLGADVAGLFGIVGAVGIFAAPLAGKVADRRGPGFVVWMGAVLAAVAWIVFGLWSSLAALVIGVIILDFGIQSALVANQHIIYAIDPEARSRLNTIFMTGMFLGGAFGSAAATAAWGYGAWAAVSALGVVFALVAIGIKFVAHHRSTTVGKTR
ncbi:predicted MFS family arabinose efflux permease [Rhizobium subbaraonis]|uniref:Predicted MFS family arabinose efflux permease n=1 Tax=Rhizobium subbaraonis TaxID=908946 RepID=A0A285U543_9HYPH|nr:MFS transporter [Rhizobium subbaraonis]SOC36787.1 predicted MFS family arabinose efflux permease [Rhizobium subbaraonis]